MKKIVRDSIGHFEVLIEHSQRPYEPSPRHVLKRMVRPLCRDFSKLLERGTRNDAWEAIAGFLKACNRIEETGRQDR